MDSFGRYRTLNLTTIVISLVFMWAPTVSAHQEKEIEELKAHIEALQQRVEQLEGQRDPQLSSAVPSVSTTVDSGKPQNDKGTEKTMALPIVVGDCPGSYKVRGSDISVKVGGYVKLDFIKDLDFIPSGDTFVQTQIPVDGTPNARKEGEARFTARQSRINFDARTSSPFGGFRAFLEWDFFGSSNSDFLLRHAFGQLGKLTAGQTWSTFVDISAWPESLGYEGPDAGIFARQGQIRWTQPVGDSTTVAVSIENPSGDFSDPVPGVDTSDALNQWPDVAAHVREQGPWGHLQLGGLVREIQFDNGMGQSGDVVGWGVTFSGRIYMLGKDNIHFQGTYGDGVGRYIQGLIGARSDAAPTGSGKFETIAAHAAFAGYQHWWTDTLRSNIGGAYGEIDNLGGQPGTAIKNFQSAGVNLVWNIIPRMTVGVQFAWARNELKDGRDGIGRRIQTSTQFNFD